MTVAVGLDATTAIVGKAAEQGVPKDGTSTTGARSRRASASPANTAAIAGNFRTGFEEVLSTLNGVSSAQESSQAFETLTAAGNDAKRAILGRSEIGSMPVIPSATASAHTLEKGKQASIVSASNPLVKRTNPSAGATAISPKEDAQSTSGHSARILHHTSSSTKSSADDVHPALSHEVVTTTIPPAPVIAQVVQPVPVKKAATTQGATVLPHTTGQITQGRTAVMATLSARSATNSSPSVSASSVSSELHTGASEGVYPVLHAADRSASHDSTLAVPESGATQKADRPLRLNKESLTPAATSEESTLATSSSKASASVEVKGAATPSEHADSVSRLRDHGSILHGTAAEAAAIQQPATATLYAQSSTAPVRDAAGIQHMPGNGGMNTSIASPEARDTFAALDSASGQPDTTWVHAGARHAEAGYLDPSLGWVSVRADVSPDGLRASVVPSSPEAAQVLGSHLSGLNSYLAEHHGSAITASLSSPESSESNSMPTGSAGQNQGQEQAHSGTPQQRNFTQQFITNSPAEGTSSAQAIESTTITRTHSGGISVIA